MKHLGNFIVELIALPLERSKKIKINHIVDNILWTKKGSFPLGISLVNMNRSVVFCRFFLIY